MAHTHGKDGEHMGLTGKQFLLQVAATAASLGSSIIFSAWTVARWVGLSGRALSGTLLVLLFLVGACAGVGAVLVTARVRRNRKALEAAATPLPVELRPPLPRITVLRSPFADWLGARIATFFWATIITLVVVELTDAPRAAGVVIAALLIAAASAFQVWQSQSGKP
jgi:hypothetical protein